MCKAGTGAPRGNRFEFLTSVYTTNEDSRYSTFEESNASDEESLKVAMDAYYSDIEKLVNEELLDELMSNRIPMKYDQYYQENPITVENVALSDSDTSGRYDYAVTANQNNEDVIFTGTIGFDEDQKIDYFYEKQ